MKASILCCFLICLTSFLPETLFARGRGSLGGGRAAMPRPNISRPNMSRPNMPNISRPNFTLPARPATPSFSRPTRPSIQRPSISNWPSTRPSLPSSLPANWPSTRPAVRPSNPERPMLRPSNRSDFSKLPGNLPGKLPGNLPDTFPGKLPSVRPGFERPAERPTLPGLNDRPGIGNRPKPLPDTLPGIGQRPGFDKLPGFDKRPDFDNLPAFGKRPWERPDVNDRIKNIQTRLDYRPTHRPGDHGNRWDALNHQWNSWQHRHYYAHYHWHYGIWHRPWVPCYRWGYWWNRYPCLTAYGVTAWTVNRVSWIFGYSNYYNPYYGGNTIVINNNVYDYSQPLLLTSEASLDAAPDASTLADPPPTAITTFDEARQAFHNGNYQLALRQADEALKEMPQDAAVHEFRALALFALGKYKEAATTLYAVLSVGPGWDWTTMSGLYPDVATYTNQLRKLENYRKVHPDDAAARLVLAYHYLTASNQDAAETELRKLVQLTPKDPLAIQLLQNIDPEAEAPQPVAQVKPPEQVNAIPKDKLVGSWTAKRDQRSFAMDLNQDGTFTWSYSAGDQPAQKVTGLWNIGDDGVRAMEMNDESAMLAQLSLDDNRLDFYMLGDARGDDPLHFVRARKF